MPISRTPKVTPRTPRPTRLTQPKPVIGEIKTPVPDVPKPGETTKKNVYTETYKEKKARKPVPKVVDRPIPPIPSKPRAKPLEPNPVIGEIKLPKPKLPKVPKPVDTYKEIVKGTPKLKVKRRKPLLPPKNPVR